MPSMAKNPALNRIHQRTWYARIRQDPVRWRAFLEKRRDYKRSNRNAPMKPSLSRIMALHYGNAVTLNRLSSHSCERHSLSHAFSAAARIHNLIAALRALPRLARSGSLVADRAQSYCRSSQAAPPYP